MGEVAVIHQAAYQDAFVVSVRQGLAVVVHGDTPNRPVEVVAEQDIGEVRVTEDVTVWAPDVQLANLSRLTAPERCRLTVLGEVRAVIAPAA